MNNLMETLYKFSGRKMKSSDDSDGLKDFSEESFALLDLNFALKALSVENFKVDTLIYNVEMENLILGKASSLKKNASTESLYYGLESVFSMEDGEEASEKSSNIFVKIWDGIKTIFKKIIDAIKKLFSAIGRFFTGKKAEEAEKAAEKKEEVVQEVEKAIEKESNPEKKKEYYGKNHTVFVASDKAILVEAVSKDLGSQSVAKMLEEATKKSVFEDAKSMLDKIMKNKIASVDSQYEIKNRIIKNIKSNLKINNIVEFKPESVVNQFLYGMAKPKKMKYNSLELVKKLNGGILRKAIVVHVVSMNENLKTLDDITKKAFNDMGKGNQYEEFAKKEPKRFKESVKELNKFKDALVFYVKFMASYSKSILRLREEFASAIHDLDSKTGSTYTSDKEKEGKDLDDDTNKQMEEAKKEDPDMYNRLQGNSKKGEIL